jgi:predicted Ser/Thr protein kinase
MATEQLLNGRYRLLRPLGAGGMASVYLAEDLRLGRRVAVKILHPQFAADPAFVARFDAEARTVASLSHPNIVQVYDVGHDGDRYYIVMEYVEGETLKDAITRDGPFAAKRALRVIGSVLAALDFAHAHNLVHRDIKSQNVLLTPTGDVKVADFGIARAVDGAGSATLTATNMVIGTVQYFSPEQAQGRPATPQSDVYAAGIVLFEMLTGALPFAADNPLAVAMQQINQAAPLPTRLNRAIPAAVEAIVLKAMAKNPSERYTGASAMKAAVDGVLAGATESTRVTPRAAPPPQTATTRQQAATRTTRAAPVVNVGPRAAAAPPRPGSRNLWLTIVALALVLLALLAALFHNGAFAGFGGAGAPTATTTPTVIASPTATVTAAATVPVIVPQPTVTAKPTSRPPTHTPAATDTPTALAATNTPTPAATDTPTPATTDTPTAPAATDTPATTDTPTPAATDTPAPTATTTDTPAPSTTPDATGTAQASGQGQPGTVNLDPKSVHPGDSFTVSGDSWPPGATLTITAAFDNGTAQLGQVKAHGDGTFSAPVQLDPSTTPGDYIITVTDDQGDSQTSTLTITQ